MAVQQQQRIYSLAIQRFEILFLLYFPVKGRIFIELMIVIQASKHSRTVEQLQYKYYEDGKT